MQGQECSEWVPGGASPRGWLSLPSGMAASDWQNPPNQVSPDPTEMRLLQVVL